MMPLADVSPVLVRELTQLGGVYGPVGVALAAAQLTDVEFVRDALNEAHPPGDALRDATRDAVPRQAAAVAGYAVAVIITAVSIPVVAVAIGMAVRLCRWAAGG